LHAPKQGETVMPIPLFPSSAARLAIVGAALACLSSPTSAENLLRPAPLILKDGRIASVSVHAIAFPESLDLPAGAEAAELDALARSIATDCFLTAQVIGHVARGEPGTSDRDAAHRLARARADAVQAKLAEAGLAVGSIASVWDWQFLVDSPRATIWVFQLGEGCAGEPLVAQAPSAAPSSVEADADAIPQAGPATAVADEPAPSTTVATASPARTPAADASEPTVVAERLAEPEPPTSTAALAAGDAGAAAADAAGTDPGIVFETNSSFFPEGAEATLADLLGRLPADGSYVVTLEASAGGADVRNASNAEEARRYNRWLAGRRADRVQEWLAGRAGDRELAFERRFTDDDRRRVTVSVAASG
jgi:outer membrane protein OmpA-like peptidoglycan-associated protein